MSLLKRIIRIAAPLPDLESYKRYLFIGPHPDDIEIGAGASAAKLASKGAAICFLICTDGRFGDGYSNGLHGDALAAKRKLEAISSASKLGVSDVRFLDFSDGGFYDFELLCRRIAGIIADFQPEVIFAPDPDVRSECHPDHLNAGKAAKKFAFLAPYDGIMKRYGAASAPVAAVAFYMTASANRFINTSGFLQIQLDSIFNCHLSQYPEGCAAASSVRTYLKLRAADFGIRKLCRTAEGFRVLGTTQMHCLPEAD